MKIMEVRDSNIVEPEIVVVKKHFKRGLSTCWSDCATICTQKTNLLIRTHRIDSNDDQTKKIFN